jgi:hypothetical protein
LQLLIRQTVPADEPHLLKSKLIRDLTMASDDTKTTSKVSEKPAEKSAETSKPASESSGGSSASYSRGENQKVVTKAYRDNWNLIFGKPETKAKAAPNGTKAAKAANSKTSKSKKVTAKVTKTKAPAKAAKKKSKRARGT